MGYAARGHPAHLCDPSQVVVNSSKKRRASLSQLPMPRSSVDLVRVVLGARKSVSRSKRALQSKRCQRALHAHLLAEGGSGPVVFRLADSPDAPFFRDWTAVAARHQTVIEVVWDRAVDDASFILRSTELGGQSIRLTLPSRVAPAVGSLSGRAAWALRSAQMTVDIEPFVSLVQQLHRRPVIHTHSYVIARAGASIAKRRACPFITSEHHPALTGASPFFQASQTGFRVAGQTYAQASLVLPVSQWHADRLVQAIPQARYSVLEPPIAFPGRFHQEPPARPFRFISACRVTPVKRLDLALQAFGELRLSKDDSAEFHVVGDGPELARLRDVADKLGLDESVRFHGAMDFDDLLSFESTSGAFVSTSLVETFGKSAAEAACLGLPLVTTPAGALPEVMRGIPGSFVTVDESALAISAAMLKALQFTREDRRARAVEAQSRWGAGSTATSLSRIYRMVTGEC